MIAQPVANPISGYEQMICDDPIEFEETPSVDENFHLDAIFCEDNVDLSLEDETCLVKKSYADYYNQLCVKKHVPMNTVSDIIRQSLMRTREENERKENLLRNKLEQQGLASSVIENVVEDVFNDDPGIKALTDLQTEHKRKLYIKGSFVYIEPNEIDLNKQERNGRRKTNQDVYHYVDVKRLVENMVKDQSFKQMRSEFRTESEEWVLKDLKDGSAYKRNDFFKRYPEALTAILYSDAIELKNPLGSAKGTYKVVMVYLSFAEITKIQRSKIDLIRTVMVFREELLKRHSIESIFKPLVDDLLELEKNGILIHDPEPLRIRVGVLCYIADNLEAHNIGKIVAFF